MKYLYLPIILIASLIVFFVIIDRKEFNRYDDTQTDQRVSSTANRERGSVPKMKPATEVKPAVRTKSFETDPENAIKTETALKPIESETDSPVAVPVVSAEEAIKANENALHSHQKGKQHDTRSVAEIKTEDKLIPVAVPLLTPEEAIKANKEAIRLQRNKAIAKTFQSIGLNNNRIHFALSLLPLLFLIDVLLLKRKKKSSKANEYFSLSRRMRILFSVSLLAFGILVFVPWSVYFGNSPQFTFIFQDFVNWNLRVLTISIIGATIVLLLIPPTISDYLVAIIAGLGLCVYVQAMFMNQNLGTMNGDEPAWSEHRIFGTINLIIWILIVVFPIILRKFASSYFSKALSMTTGIVLFLEILATASMVISANQSVWARTDTYFADGSKQFQLSKEKNVIIFVFDTLGSGFVHDCFERCPETKKIVKDFIWYIDARSNYSSTFLGLPCNLTGTVLTGPAPNYHKLFERIWRTPSAKSFYKQINDAGYDARLYCSASKYIFGPSELFHDYFSNIQSREVTYQINYNNLYSCLKKISGYSFAPFFFKKSFFYTFDFSNDVVQTQIADIPSDKASISNSNSVYLRRMLSSGLSFDSNKPVLSFNYLLGVHPPFRYDEYSNEVDTPFDDPLQTTKSCFFILSEFIRFLKEADIYDNTAILICSDHGGWGEKEKILSTDNDMTFMIKPFQANKIELTIDNSKVQSIDILPTLLKMACGDDADFKNFDGYPSFSIPNDRIRKMYSLNYSKEWPSLDPDLDKCYHGKNCFGEYIIINTDNPPNVTLKHIRKFPLIVVSKDDE